MFVCARLANQFLVLMTAQQCVNIVLMIIKRLVIRVTDIFCHVVCAQRSHIVTSCISSKSISASR